MKDQEARFNEGINFLKANQLNEALAIFNQLVAENPNQAEYYSERGVTYFHLQNKKAALADMDKAVELEPLKSYRYSSRAYVRGHFKQIDAAIKDYEKAVELDPEDAIALNNLGLLQEQLGYHKKAQNNFKVADELDQSNQVDGRTEQGIQGQEIEARNIQKEIDEENKNKSIWTELKSLGSKEGISSFAKFVKSGFKET